MIPLKPYAWVNESSSPKKVEYLINLVTSTGSYQVSSSTTSFPDSNTILITCQITTSSSGSTYSGNYNIPGTSSANKVVIAVMQGTTLKGKITLRLNVSHFSYNPIKPLCWIKLTAVTDTEIYFCFEPPASAGLTGPTVTTDSTAHKLTLDYALTSGSESTIERSFPLDAYDPTTYEYIEVQINQGGTLKGKGTTSQTDADSSGDD